MFQGTPDWLFHAYTADTGKEVWSFDCQCGIRAGPLTFRATGEHYAWLAEYGGSMGITTQSD